MAEDESKETREPKGNQPTTNPYEGYSSSPQGSQSTGYQSPYSPSYSGGGMSAQPYQPSQSYQPTQAYQPSQFYQGGYQQGPQPYQQQAVSPAYTQPTGMQQQGMPSGGLPSSIAQQVQTSYIENILRLNAGKVATVYMTFEGSKQWTDRIFKGVIEAAGKDHIILRDPETQRRYLLLMIYLDYITFESEINYFYAPAPQFYSYSGS